MGQEVDLTEVLSDEDAEDFEELSPEEQEDNSADIPESMFQDEDEEELTGTEEDVEEEEESAEEKEDVEEPEPKDKGKTKEEKRELTAGLKDILAQIGKDEILKAKGAEIKVKDLTPEEAQAFLQKGFRFHQAMDEVAKREATLQERETSVYEAARRIQYLQDKLESQLKAGVSQQGKTMPKELEINEDYDDPGTVTLKKAAQEQWKANQSLAERLNTLEGGAERGKAVEQEQVLIKEIENLREDFPLASVEETIAVHALTRGKIPLRKIMQTGHTHYGSVEHVNKVFKTCPEIKKAVYADAIKTYHAKQQKAQGKRVALRPAVRGAKPVTTKIKKPDITFENVGSAANKYLRELQRMRRGDDD